MSAGKGVVSEDFVRLLSENMSRVSGELSSMRESVARELGTISTEVKRIEKIERDVDAINDRQRWIMIKVGAIGTAAGFAASALWKKIIG